MRDGEEHPVIKELNLGDQNLISEILTVQKLAYREEARVIGYDRIPALADTKETITECRETFYGLFCKEQLSAVISITLDGSVLTICRLVVRPSMHHRGIASRLLSHLARRYPEAVVLRVRTAVKNDPALKLYKAHHFVETRRWKMPDGLELVELERRRSGGMEP
jgi:ribosomal protein S18 acetylase RimI-like enzyme